MASSDSPKAFPIQSSFPNAPDTNTTFVQADPFTFRTVVQRLTGKTSSGDMAQPPRKPPFKLHERRPTAARKLDILPSNDASVNVGAGGGASNAYYSSTVAPSPPLYSPLSSGVSHHRNFLPESMVMVSPVSPLEYLAARGSPRTPRSACMEGDEEIRAIAEKGFYLHPSPLSTPRGSDPPELLPLFPLHSPGNDHSSSSSRKI